MKRFSTLPLIAAITAFLLAAIGLLSAIQQVALALFSLVPLLAGIGILRKQVWSAYGFALFELTQLAVMPLLLLRAGSIARAAIVFTVGLDMALVALFFLAGKSLAASGARRGSPFLWIGTSCFFTVPLIFVEAFVIPTGGMEDTLLIGDRILARVLPRVHPGQGDIVVFHYPMDPRQVFVKRVVGLPGDRIRIASKIVYRNGVALTEPYAVHKFSTVDQYRDNFPSGSANVGLQPGSREMLGIRDMLQNHVANGEAIVPVGKYFVLGDNRDNSLDSRYWGFLDISDIIGKPILIYDSTEAPVAGVGAGKTGLRRPRRWGRLFKPL